MSEDDLLEEVIKICDRESVLYFHSTDSRRDLGKGYPDLTLIGQERHMWAELKSATGSSRPEQSKFHWRIVAAGGYWVMWRPRDLASGEIEHAIQLLNLRPGDTRLVGPR